MKGPQTKAKVRWTPPPPHKGTLMLMRIHSVQGWGETCLKRLVSTKKMYPLMAFDRHD